MACQEALGISWDLAFGLELFFGLFFFSGKYKFDNSSPLHGGCED